MSNHIGIFVQNAKMDASENHNFLRFDGFNHVGCFNNPEKTIWARIVITPSYGSMIDFISQCRLQGELFYYFVEQYTQEINEFKFVLDYLFKNNKIITNEIWYEIGRCL